LHPLKGQLNGFWAVTVRVNWRVVFRFEEHDALAMKNPPHPGGVVFRQCIEPLCLSITDAAAALDVTLTTLSELVNEKRGIPGEVAVRHSQVFGGSAEGWLVQQAQYDLAHLSSGRINTSDWNSFCHCTPGL
jgi:addiction module HigA family antidote